MQFLLLHSPVLPPSSWSACAAALLAEGHRAAIPDLRPALQAEGSHYAALVAAATADAGSGEVVVAAHSGAGWFLPHVCAALGPRSAALFVDAARLLS